MAIQYLGLDEINGSLIVLDHVPNASFDELVELQAAKWRISSGACCRNSGRTSRDSGL